MQLAADAREALAWVPTSHLMALIANVNRDTKKRASPFQPWDFWHPPGVERPRSGEALTGDVLRLIGPVIAGSK